MENSKYPTGYCKITSQFNPGSAKSSIEKLLDLPEKLANLIHGSTQEELSKTCRPHGWTAWHGNHHLAHIEMAVRKK
jgi:hypothetical protein